MDSVTVLGQEVRLPVEVRVASAAMATFIVRRDPVCDLIGHTGLQPKGLPGGRALCIVACVQYVDNDLGAYNEVAVAFPVDAGTHGPSGAYIHQLPVDQAFTLAAGREIWGFPKFMAAIDLSIDRRASCQLRADGEDVLRLDVAPRPVPLPSRPARLSAYSAADGALHRTPFWTHAHHVRGGPFGATLELGTQHPMARDLRSLGLPKRAVVSTIVGTMQSRFEAPV
jgi:hypothetical protein